MQQWEYKVVFVDYRGRISVEGQETLIGTERRTAFVRRYLDSLGAAGWELASLQPLDAHAAYYVFKRPREGAAAGSTGAANTSAAGSTTDGEPMTAL